MAGAIGMVRRDATPVRSVTLPCDCAFRGTPSRSRYRFARVASVSTDHPESAAFWSNPVAPAEVSNGGVRLLRSVERVAEHHVIGEPAELEGFGEGQREHPTLFGQERGGGLCGAKEPDVAAEAVDDVVAKRFRGNDHQHHRRSW